MITVNNEFETVPAFEHLAGSNQGTWSDREVAIELINVLHLVSGVDCGQYYKDLAGYADDSSEIDDLLTDLVDELNEHMPMPEFCSITVEDSEWRVMPCLENAQDECESFAEVPEDHKGDFILQVSDHGNVECYQWDYSANEYKSIWGMV